MIFLYLYYVFMRLARIQAIIAFMRTENIQLQEQITNSKPI